MNNSVETFPNKKYKIIYADPPWSYESNPNHKRGIWGIATDNYDTMSMDELKQLPVQDIADDDCILFMWATFPNLQQALDLIKAWGFEYKTVAFVWEKFDKTNNVLKKYGLGWYTRSNVEIVMIGRKGKFERKSAAVQQVVKSTIGEHSEKPNEVRNRILKLCGDLPRIELFARTKVHGWDVWGNDEKLNNTPLENWL
uniref:ORF63 n=1 Tax=Nitrosopumilaceae spindle-shaped virus TaxID=3065433 RepID=A0AAT9JAK0_9VIRU